MRPSRHATGGAPVRGEAAGVAETSADGRNWPQDLNSSGPSGNRQGRCPPDSPSPWRSRAKASSYCCCWRCQESPQRGGLRSSPHCWARSSLVEELRHLWEVFLQRKCCLSSPAAPVLHLHHLEESRTAAGAEQGPWKSWERSPPEPTSSSWRCSLPGALWRRWQQLYSPRERPRLHHFRCQNCRRAATTPVPSWRQPRQRPKWQTGSDSGRPPALLRVGRARAEASSRRCPQGKSCRPRHHQRPRPKTKTSIHLAPWWSGKAPPLPLPLHQRTCWAGRLLPGPWSALGGWGRRSWTAGVGWGRWTAWSLAGSADTRMAVPLHTERPNAAYIIITDNSGVSDLKHPFLKWALGAYISKMTLKHMTIFAVYRLL